MPSKYVKKTIMLNQDYINKAVRLFRSKTEKEAVNRALEFAVEEANIIAAHDDIGGAGIIEQVYK